MADMSRRPVLVRAALLPILAAVAVGAGACAAKPAVTRGASADDTRYLSQSQGVTVVPAGQRTSAPDLAGTTLDGKVLDVSSLRGRVVVLNFWASWCPPCRAEAPALAEVARQYAARGVSFVGIDIKDDLSAAQIFQRAQGTPYPSLYDQPNALALGFRPRIPATPPTTIILDQHGKIAARILGETTGALLRSVLDSVLAGGTSST
jgi:thiol-disulfide isomerase/thioredoxin